MTSIDLERKAGNLKEWNSPEITQALLDDEIEVPLSATLHCLDRMKKVRSRLDSLITLPLAPEFGPLTDWVLSGMTGRENILLLGVPGTGKNLIATAAFRLIGLTSSMANAEALARSLGKPMPDDGTVFAWWQKRMEEERQVHKLFHFQFSRFSSLEEVFGPMEISLLKKGTVVRINFNMLTGPGVRGAFLDELFKATGALLNALLQVLNERTYFNWGVNWPADLFAMIAASNELPSAFGGQNQGAVTDDFSTLYALLDRLSVRLVVETPSGEGGVNSQFAKAAEQTRKADASRICPTSVSREMALASPNDVLALSRAMVQGHDNIPGPSLFEKKSYDRVWQAFIELCCQLKDGETRAHEGLLSWSISARKTRVWKVLLAHSLLTSQDNTWPRAGILLNPRSLHALSHIWDSQHRAGDLRDLVERKVTTLL